MKCLNCNKELKINQIKYCSVECAKKKASPNAIRLERICSNCGKIEYVSGYSQLKRQCRSCSKLGNTASKNMSEESKQKISKASKGRTPWNKGKTGIYSEETKRSMGVKHIGTNLNQKHKEAITKGLQKYYQNHEGPNLGKKRSEIEKTKTSETLQFNRNIRIKSTKLDVINLCKELDLKLIEIHSGDNYVGRTQNITLECKCGNSYIVTLGNLINKVKLTCKRCAFASSKPEIEIYDFLIKDLEINPIDIQTNKRPQFINGKELDIWIPSKNIAIEFHGLAIHSEKSIFYKKNIVEVRQIHEFKYLACKQHNIKLIQIFEDEWRDKPEIIKSMIAARIGLSKTKIMARKCEIKQIDICTRKEFFDKTHIAGDTNAQITWGLYYNNELVSAISLRRTWNKAYGDNVIEIARFASNLNTIVMGGFQKLFKIVKNWAFNNNYKTLLTYADCRFGSGQVYNKTGFLHLGKTKPNYFYEKNGIRENRFKHRKAPNLTGTTEREQQNNLGWYAIYDAGNEIYILNLS